MRGNIEVFDAAAYVENPRMFLTAGLGQFINRQRPAARLQPFLQQRLRIFRRTCTGSDTLGEQATHDIATDRPTCVGVDRRNQCLECIGEDRIATKAAALELARAQMETITDFRGARDFRERCAVDKGCAQAGHRALVGARMAFVDEFGNEQVEQCVAEEFQAFVIGMPDAAMGQRPVEQLRIAKTVTEYRVIHCPLWSG